MTQRSLAILFVMEGDGVTLPVAVESLTAFAAVQSGKRATGVSYQVTLYKTLVFDSCWPLG